MKKINLITDEFSYRGEFYFEGFESDKFSGSLEYSSLKNLRLRFNENSKTENEFTSRIEKNTKIIGSFEELGVVIINPLYLNNIEFRYSKNINISGEIDCESAMMGSEEINKVKYCRFSINDFDNFCKRKGAVNNNVNLEVDFTSGGKEFKLNIFDKDNCFFELSCLEDVEKEVFINLIYNICHFISFISLKKRYPLWIKFKCPGDEIYKDFVKSLFLNQNEINDSIKEKNYLMQINLDKIDFQKGIKFWFEDEKIAGNGLIYESLMYYLYRSEPRPKLDFFLLVSLMESWLIVNNESFKKGSKYDDFLKDVSDESKEKLKKMLPNNQNTLGKNIGDLRDFIAHPQKYYKDKTFKNTFKNYLTLSNFGNLSEEIFAILRFEILKYIVKENLDEKDLKNIENQRILKFH